MAVRHKFGKNIDWGYTQKNYAETWLDAGIDFYLRENLALGLYGSRVIDAHNIKGQIGQYGWKLERDYAYETGVRLKFAF